MVAKIPGQLLNCYLFVVYRSPSTDDRMFDCLCEAMGSIQSVDPKSVFCFVGDFNCHHSEWLGLHITDAHGVAAFDFAAVADCSQLVNGPTHVAGGVLDLVLTNVPDLCDVQVHGNIGRSDHASLGVALNLSPAVAGFDVARRVPLKSRVNWNAVCEALSGLNWRSIFSSPTMVLDFDREVSRIMEWFVPMFTIRRRGEDAAWFGGDCRRAFELKQSAYHRWCRNRSFVNWDLFCEARGTANRLHAAAKARYSADCRRNLDDCASANALWRTLKVTCLVRSLIFLPFVRLVVHLFLIRQGRLSFWVPGLTANSHETLLSCRRPVTLGLHSVALPSEHVMLSGTCWILIRKVEWTRLVASLCFFGRLFLLLLQNWVVFFVDCCVVVSFR